MNAEKAAELLTVLSRTHEITLYPDFMDSVLLGAEALKQTQQDRQGNPLLDGELLPGETDD